MKIFKHRNFMSLIFSVIVSLPFLSILSRSAYVAVNKNAKDSYYGETINEENFVNVNKLLVNNTYFVNFNNNTQTTNDYNTTISCSNIEILSTNFDINESDLETISNASYFKLWYNPTYNQNFLTFENYGSNFPSVNKFINFSFIYLGSNNDNLNISNYFGNQVYEKQYNKYSYLDNAFDYSISRFVDENHWGKLNFFEWFTNLFIDINSNNNTLYLHFINWYMNYFLMVSCAYILFLVLMWFINYSRRLLERGMNYDW